MIAKNIYRSLYILIGITGILIQSGVFNHAFYLYSFNYYTIISNILCVLFFMCRLYYDNIKTPKSEFKRFIMSPLVKYSITMCVMLTFLVYHYILVPTWNKNSGPLNIHLIGNYITHYIIPIMTIVDFLIFDGRKIRLPWYTPFAWLIVPGIYYIFILIRASFLGNIGSTSSPYPYFFIDLNIHPLSEVVNNVLLLLTGFIFIGYILWFVYVYIQKINTLPIKSRNKKS